MMSVRVHCENIDECTDRIVFIYRCHIAQVWKKVLPKIHARVLCGLKSAEP
jgi:hypothetical protein